MTVVGQGEVEPIADRADDGQCGPGDGFVSSDKFHRMPECVHRGEDSASGCDRMKHSADLGRVKIVIGNVRIILAEIDECESVGVAVESTEFDRGVRTDRAPAVVENDCLVGRHSTHSRDAIEARVSRLWR